jgi:hypothetical protein
LQPVEAWKTFWGMHQAGQSALAFSVARRLVLRLAVNNGTNGHTAGAADKTAPDANARDQGTVPERGNAGNDAEKPTEGDLT